MKKLKYSYKIILILSIVLICLVLMTGCSEDNYMLGEGNSVDDYEDLSSNEACKNLEVLETVEIEDDRQFYSDYQMQVLYNEFYKEDILHHSENSFTVLAIEKLGTYKEENIIKIYAIVRKSICKFYNNNEFIEESGYLVPAVVTYEVVEEDNYRFIDRQIPEDGSYYGDSIRRMCKDRPEMAEKMLNIDYDNLNKKFKSNVVMILKNNGCGDVNLDGY